MVKDSEDEDMSLDFGFIKRLFNKNPNQEKGKKKENPWFIVLLLLIPIILGAYFRTIPANLPQTDLWAESTVMSQVKNQITQSIEMQYPNLPTENKQALIEEEYNRQISVYGTEIDKSIEESAAYFKGRYRDENDITYLGDIDSYHWLRYTRNIIEKGTPADEYRDGVAYDNHMNAPSGKEMEKNIYPYIEAAIYKVMDIFVNSGSLLILAAYYTPLVISILSIILAFFIVKKIAGNAGGLVASILIAVHPMILSRTLGSDNDIINIIFPLLILWFFIEAFESKRIKKKSIMTAVSGILIGVYSFAWTGYWMMLYFITGTMVAYLGYLILKEYNKDRNFSFSKEHINTLKMIFIFLAFSALSIIMISGTDEFLSLTNKVVRVTTLKVASKNVWPNVYTTVAELNAASLTDIIGNIGGNLLFALGLMGIVLLFTDFKENKMSSMIYSGLSFAVFMILISMKGSISLMAFLVGMIIPLVAGFIVTIYFKHKNVDIKYSVLLTMWFISTIYASTKGVRFIFTIIPVYAVSIGIFMGKAFKSISDFGAEAFQLDKKIPQVIVLVFILFLLLDPIKLGYAVANSYTPHVNDVWVETLENIREGSGEDAIINSWWDFGHWFKYFGDRAVTSDGASQNQPQAHWVGKALLTDNENVSMGILRMLDCGSNDAFNELNKVLNNSITSLDIINEIIVLDKNSAKALLKEYVSEEVAQKVIGLTHCEPPEDFFITSEDMVGKSGVWAHFGIWDFRRADIYNDYKILSNEEFIRSLETRGYSSDEARKLLNQLSSFTEESQYNDWIASWPTYGGNVGCSLYNESLVVCGLQSGNNGQVIPLAIDLETMEAYVETTEGKIYPQKFGFVKDSEYIVKEYDGNGLGYGLALRENDGSYDLLMMSTELTGSMFTRLFYFDGIGLDHFGKFTDMTDVTGQRIISWKLNW